MLPQNSGITKSDRILLCVQYFLIWYVSCHCALFLFTGYYLTIEVRHVPNRWYVFYEYLLWLLGVEASEL